MENKHLPGKALLLKLVDIVLSKPKGAVIIKTLHGFKLRIDPVKDKGVEQSIYLTGTYEAGTLYIVDHLLKPDDIFFDIGANIGLMTVFAAKKVGKRGHVHSFEPEPETFEIFKFNCNLNHLNNITLNNLAIGAEEKESTIYPNLDINRGASSLVRKDGTMGKKVTVLTLDKYIEENKVRSIKLVKIDIEGYELEMLKGAVQLLQSTEAPIICIEYSNDVQHTGTASDVYDFIKGINHYQVFKFQVWKGVISKLVKVNRKEELPQHDNIFCFLPHQLSQADPSLFN